MTVVSTKEIGTGLYTALNVSAITTLATGGVWDTIVPKDVSFPVVRWQLIDETDIHTFAEIGYQRFIYQVEAIVPDNRDLASDIATEIHTILEGGTLAALTGHDVTYRQKMHEFPTPEQDGRQYWKSGGTYHIGVRA